MFPLFVFFTIFSFFDTMIYGKDIKGALSLDKYTFDKVVKSNLFDVLVKFDEEYAYGEQEDEFEKFVDVINEQAQHHVDFLVARVVVEKQENNNDENKKEDNENDDEEDNNDKKKRS